MAGAVVARRHRTARLDPQAMCPPVCTNDPGPHRDGSPGISAKLANWPWLSNGAWACFSHDHIDLERNPFGRESQEPIELPLGRSIFDQEVATFDVAEVTHSLTEALKQTEVDGGQVGAQVAYPSDLGHLLRPGGERAQYQAP